MGRANEARGLPTRSRSYSYLCGWEQGSATRLVEHGTEVHCGSLWTRLQVRNGGGGTHPLTMVTVTPALLPVSSVDGESGSGLWPPPQN